jgi:hypothetical protein
MMRLAIFIVVLLCLPQMTIAQNKAEKNALCALYAAPDFASQKQAHISADYVPGIDVRGKPVAAAEINALPDNHLVRHIRFPVTLDLAQSLSLVLPQGAEFPAQFGMISIHGDKVFWNQMDISAKTKDYCLGTETNSENVETLKKEIPLEPRTTLGEVPLNISPDESDVISGAGY